MYHVGWNHHAEEFCGLELQYIKVAVILSSTRIPFFARFAEYDSSLLRY